MTAEARWQMRDRATGEVRGGAYRWPHEGSDGLEFIWTEGNMACDGNRALAFYGSADAIDPPIPEALCCEAMPGGRFELLALDLDGRRVL